MKPTITVSAWNFCQNHCAYCVSGSHTAAYKVENCENGVPKNEITNFEQSLKWIDKFRPGATIHVSGGEPLLRPDIDEQIRLIVASGRTDTTIFTNGLLMQNHLSLLELPVKWCVTYHQDCGVSVDDWLSLVNPIKERRHVLHTVVSTLEHFKRAYELRPYFLSLGWNYYEKWDRRPENTMIHDFRANPADIEDIASNRLTLIVPNGSVFPCNNAKDGAVGNVFDMTYDKERAERMNEKTKSCAERNVCSAFQTAVLLETI
jgi:MoaA/NifB/PqqE/SkfB family radical SAM enzyme